MTSAAAVEKDLGEILHHSLSFRRGISETDVADIMSRAEKRPREDWWVAVPYFGCTCGKGSAALGPCWIVDPRVVAQSGAGNIPREVLDLATATSTWKTQPPCIVATKCLAADEKFAYQNAEECVVRIDHVLHYMVGDPGRYYRFGLRDQAGSHERAASTAQRSSYWWARDGGLLEVDLSSETFQSPVLGHDAIWRLLTEETPSGMGRRVLLSVEWIGRALGDEDSRDAFIQHMIGIEALLGANREDVLSAGGTARMAELAAFILGKNLDERVEREDEFRRLYKIRCALVHGADKAVDRVDLDLVHRLGRGLCTRFLVDPRIRAMNTYDELEAWARACRLTCPGDPAVEGENAPTSPTPSP